MHITFEGRFGAPFFTFGCAATKCVNDFWNLEPVDKTLMVFSLQVNGCYGVLGRYAGDDKVAVQLLGDLVIDLGELFTADSKS